MNDIFGLSPSHEPVGNIYPPPRDILNNISNEEKYNINICGVDHGGDDESVGKDDEVFSEAIVVTPVSEYHKPTTAFFFF